MLRKLTRVLIFILYLASSGYLLLSLLNNGLNGDHFIHFALLLTQFLGFSVGSTELFLLHRKNSPEITFGQSEHVGVLCFIEDEIFETARISLLSLKHLRGSPKVYVYAIAHRPEIESLCSEFNFEYEYQNFDPPQQFDQFLITNGHTIVYPDAILVGQRRLNDKISFVELNHSNYSSHALRDSKYDRDASRAYLIASACGTYSVPIFTGGPILTQRKNCNLDLISNEQNIPSFSEVVARAASTGHRGTITSHPCCECMSHNEVDHNLSSRTARVKVSKKLRSHPEYIDTAKGIIRRYIGWYYMRFFWLRSIGVLLSLMLILNFAVYGIPKSIFIVGILGSFLIAQISSFLLSKMLGDYRNPLERIRDLVLDCEAFLYATVLKPQTKSYFRSFHVRLFPFYLSLIAVFTFASSAFGIFGEGFLPNEFIYKFSTLALVCVALIALYKAMARHLSARQREFARRSVSITGSSSYESMWIVDLTHRGAAYVSDTSFELGEETPLVFRVPTVSGDSIITVVGKVTYCAPRGDKFQVGVAFKELSQQALDDLTLYCSVLYPYRQARQIDESENLFDNVDFNFPKSKESRKNMLSFSVYLLVASTLFGLIASQAPLMETDNSQTREVSSSTISTSVALSNIANSPIYEFDSLQLSDNQDQQFTISSTLYVDNDLNGEVSPGDEPLTGINIELFNPRLNDSKDTQSPVAQAVSDANGQYSFRFINSGSYYVKISDFGSEYEPADSGVEDFRALKTSSGFRSKNFQVNSENNGNIKELAFSFQRKYDLSLSSEVIGVTSRGFLPGDTVTYRLSATNNGPSNALGGFRITSELSESYDAKSARMTNTGGYSPCGFNGLSLECISNTVLAPGETRSLEFSIVSNVATSASSNRRAIVSEIEPSKLDRREFESNYLNTNNSITSIIPVGQPNSLGGRVFLDSNLNGILDSGEYGVGGIRVGLLQFKDVNGNGKKDPGETPEIANDVSDPLGFYGVASGKASFQALEPGSQYGLIFSKFPKGFVASVLDLGEDDLGQGDKKKAENSLAWITLESSQVKTDANYGLTSNKSDISKIAYVDRNKNAKFDDSDFFPQGLDGRLLQWIDTNSNGKIEVGELNDKPIGVSAIDSQGQFRFSSVQNSIFPTKYALEIDLPEGYQIKGNRSKGTVRTKFESLEAFQESKTVLLETGLSVTGNFWIDFNFNSKQDDLEFGARSLELVLVDSNNKIITKTATDENGNYVFNRVPTGQYFLGIEKNSIPKGFSFGGIGYEAISKDITGRSDITIQVQGNGEQKIRSIPMIPASSIEGKLFEPKDSTGRSSNLTRAISSSGINLDSNNLFIGATKTSDKGKFGFSNLKPGRYSIEAENDSFESTESVYLVPGETKIAINENLDQTYPINILMDDSDIPEIAISKSLDRNLKNAVIMISAACVAGILLVLARRRKLIYRSR